MNQNNDSKMCNLPRINPIIFVLALVMLFGCGTVQAQMPSRIVVLPFYIENGLDASQGGQSTLHYRRILRFINNQLVAEGMEVVNPFAGEGKEKEYNRFMERTREDSALASRDICKKYNTDAAYMVWLKVDTKNTADGYCKASARLDGEGFDSAGNDLGAGMSKTFKVTRRSCDDATAEVEKEVGDLVGRKLTAGYEGSRRMGASDADAGGILSKRIAEREGLINVRLDGGTEYTVVEAFGKILNTVGGVTETKVYDMRIKPDNPQASTVFWKVQTQGTDIFRLQANIIKRVNDILEACGSSVVDGVPYRYTKDEISLMKGLRPGTTGPKEIQFVVDRELVRDRELSGRFEKCRGKGSFL